MAVLKQLFALLFLATLVAESVSFAIESRSAVGGTALELAREATPLAAAAPLDPVADASGAEQPLERETRGLKKKKLKKTKKSKKSHKKHGKKGGGYHG